MRSRGEPQSAEFAHDPLAGFATAREIRHVADVLPPRPSDSGCDHRPDSRAQRGAKKMTGTAEMPDSEHQRATAVLKRATIVAGAAAAVVLALASTAGAATFVVTNTNDSGRLSRVS
jgi:hypothetical protein